MSLAERHAWMIPPDDLPADAVIDSGRRQAGEEAPGGGEQYQGDPVHHHGVQEH